VKSAATDAVWLLHLNLSWGILLCTRGGTGRRYRHTSGVATGGAVVLQESHLANGNMIESITAAIFCYVHALLAMVEGRNRQGENI
jgi:hypothetical protein